MDFKINDQELEALYGLPYLCQILYFRALRQYMNYATGIVGTSRGVSYQSLREQAYIAPHPGYKSETPSESKVRRALERLISTGLLARKSVGKKLIVECLLASRDKSVLDQLGSKPSGLAVRKQRADLPQSTTSLRDFSQQVDSAQSLQVGTPLVTGNINTTHTANAMAKSRITHDYSPSASIIQKAKNIHYENVLCPFELARFIAFHTSKGTVSCDWDAEYFYWVLNGKRNQKGAPNNDRNRKASSARTPSAFERVAYANQHFFANDTNEQTSEDHQKGYRLAMDGDD